MAYWWVNHKQTRDHEVRGDTLWSPRRNQSYDNMALAQPGDIVYSYANGVLGAVGIVIARASPCPKPTEFGGVGDYWSDEGWLARRYMSQSRASGTARLRLSPSVIVLSPA